MDCPVCQSLMIRPRSYECGHTLCHLCMLRTDLVAIEDAPPNTLPMFRCPVCRSASLVPTHDRPINHAIATLAEESPEYEDRLKQADEDFDALVDDHGEEVRELGNKLPDTEKDLSGVAKRVRKRRAHLMFQKILPAVRRAAQKGTSRLHITTKARDLAELASDIVPMLFKYGIHSVVSSPREFVVNIIKDDRTIWTGEYVNQSYVEPQSPVSPEEDESPN